MLPMTPQGSTYSPRVQGDEERGHSSRSTKRRRSRSPVPRSSGSRRSPSRSSRREQVRKKQQPESRLKARDDSRKLRKLDPSLYTPVPFKAPKIELPRVAGWKQKFRQKIDDTCRKTVCDASCMMIHSKEDSCVPCLCARVEYGIYRPSCTTKGDQIELSIAGSLVNHVFQPWSFMLRGQLCNVLCVTNPDYCSPIRDLVWMLERHGFEDEAIVNVYNNLHENIWDIVEGNLQHKPEPPASKKVASPVLQVVLMVSWGGRLKIAGQWEKSPQQVIMVGDHEEGFGPGISHSISCYGQPHGALQVIIREVKVCANDVFLLVPNSLKRETIRGVVEQHDFDVEKVAQRLSEFGEVEFLFEDDVMRRIGGSVWAAKFNES